MKHYWLNKRGFTLLEVLIAIAIFALISLASFTIFNTVLKSDEAAQKRIIRLNEIQRAFLIMERDFLQIARRSIRVDGETPLAGFIHTELQSFSLTDSAIAFVRSGWRNPALIMPRSDMQPVIYQLNDNTLERLHFNFVDSVVGQEPKIRPLLTQVSALDFEFYDGRQWQKKLPRNTIPLAIAIELTLNDFGTIKRKFLVAGDPSPEKGDQGER
jgi:general secretion pathway protein J